MTGPVLDAVGLWIKFTRWLAAESAALNLGLASAALYLGRTPEIHDAYDFAASVDASFIFWAAAFAAAAIGNLIGVVAPCHRLAVPASIMSTLPVGMMAGAFWVDGFGAFVVGRPFVPVTALCVWTFAVMSGTIGPVTLIATKRLVDQAVAMSDAADRIAGEMPSGG